MERFTWRERRLIKNLAANLVERMTMESAQREVNAFYNQLMMYLSQRQPTHA